MFRSTVSRVRLSITVLGCAVLGASLFTWAQTLRATEEGFSWVGVRSSPAPAIENAEVWQVSARCVRPFFADALQESRAKLDSYYASAPQAVRAWRNFEMRGGGAALEQGMLPQLASSDPGAGRRIAAAALERGAKLHAQYAEWYATVFNLEIKQSQWEQRLRSVVDQQVILGEATRQNFRTYSGHDVGQKGPAGNFENYVLFLLGLGGFPADQEQALKAECIHITPVKKIFTNPNYFHEIWHWPVDHVAVFSFGLELVLIGALFVPVILWIVTGDMQFVRRYIRNAASRFGTMVKELPRSRFARSLASLLRTICVKTHGIFTAPVYPKPGGPAVRFADLN